MRCRQKFSWMRTAVCMAVPAAITTLTGCTSVQTTTPPRAATEQLLLSTSADRALAGVDLSIFAGKKVYLDTTYFDSYDPKYATGTIRDALSRQGALLVASAAASDIIIEARSGALSIDNSETLFGIPSIGAPIPLAGTVTLPEIAFYKADRQHAYAKFALLAYVKESGAHLYSSGDLDGQSYDKYYRFLSASWERTDIPEKNHDEAKREKYTVWRAQYDRRLLLTIPVPAPAAPTNPVPDKTPVPKTPPATNPPSINTPPTTNAPSQLNTNTAGL
jgi:hypothetical protein